MADYVERLIELKRREFGFGRLMLLDEEMLTAAIAWQYVPRTIDATKDVESPWEAVAYDYDEWADIAQIQTVRLRSAAERLIKMNMIFPDGELPKEVAAYVMTKVSESLGFKPGAQAKPKKKKKKSELTDGD